MARVVLIFDLGSVASAKAWGLLDRGETASASAAGERKPPARLQAAGRRGSRTRNGKRKARS